MRPIVLVAVLSCALPSVLAQADQKTTLGTGRHTYEWLSGWGTLPGGKQLGNTHGCIVVDGKGRVYVNTDTDRAVMVFTPEGKLISSWGKEFRGGLHGMTLRKEGDQEFLYLAHTHRHEVAKTTLDGKVLWRIGCPTASKLYDNPAHYRPTGVAVGPDGTIYVADGYGKSYIHVFNAKREYVRSWGGRGDAEGKFKTPHGIWLDTREKTPRLVVADRENHRLQFFDLKGRFLAAIKGNLRRPCNVHQHGKDIVVADLAGRVSIFDAKNRLVTHLGDNPDPKKRARNGVPRKDWRDGHFLAPHAACFDAAGNLYVMDWVSAGRVSKLRRVK